MSVPQHKATPGYTLDRCFAVPDLIGTHEDFLIVSGLAGPSNDLAALTGDGDHLFTMAGGMGAATSTGLGLALAQPDRKVLVVTGDGEILMNIGSLAMVGVAQPTNLSIVCVDNGHYGETGYQQSHTSLGVDLEQIANGSGISLTLTVTEEDGIKRASELIRRQDAPVFVNLQVRPTDPPKIKRTRDPAKCRIRFRKSLLGHD